MSEKPVRLIDHIDTEATLRNDLICVSNAQDSTYNVERGLARLMAAVHTTPPSDNASYPSPLAEPHSVSNHLLGGTPGVSSVSKLAKGSFWGVTTVGLAAGVFILSSNGVEQESPLTNKTLDAHEVVNHVSQSPVLFQSDSDEHTSGKISSTSDSHVEESPNISPKSHRKPKSKSFIAPERALPGITVEYPTELTHAKEKEESDLVRETARLAELRTQIEKDPVNALSIANKDKKVFANGVFQEEREALSVIALIRVGRIEEARIRAAQFFIQYPNSSFTEKIRHEVNITNNSVE